MYKADRLFNEIVELENAVQRLQIEGPESLTEYFRLYTLLIFQYKEVGHLYDLYADDAVVYRENGHRLQGAHEVMRDAAVFLGGFPDLAITFADAFAVEDEAGYKLWRHYYLNGSNLGYSKYGPPTNKPLGGEKCLVMSMATVAMRSGRPQVVREFAMYSSDWIRQVCTGGERQC